MATAFLHISRHVRLVRPASLRSRGPHRSSQKLSPTERLRSEVSVLKQEPVMVRKLMSRVCRRVQWHSCSSPARKQQKTVNIHQKRVCVFGGVRPVLADEGLYMLPLGNLKGHPEPGSFSMARPLGVTYN